MQKAVATHADSTESHIGPVRGVTEVCIQWAQKVEVYDDDVILHPKFGPSCSLLQQSKRLLVDCLRHMARQTIWEDVSRQMADSVLSDELQKNGASPTPRHAGHQRQRWSAKLCLILA